MLNTLQERQGREASQLRGNRPAQTVLAQEQPLHLLQVAQIGGDGAGNIIAHHRGTGVVVGELSESITITQNSITRNWLLGIDLNGDGVTGNDPLDADTGPNRINI